MSKRIDRNSIARAMKEAAWVAKHGTREERSGKFIAPQPAKTEQRQVCSR